MNNIAVARRRRDEETVCSGSDLTRVLYTLSKRGGMNPPTSYRVRYKESLHFLFRASGFVYTSPQCILRWSESNKKKYTNTRVDDSGFFQPSVKTKLGRKNPRPSEGLLSSSALPLTRKSHLTFRYTKTKLRESWGTDSKTGFIFLRGQPPILKHSPL